jgi:hypothetical protein
MQEERLAKLPRTDTELAAPATAAVNSISDGEADLDVDALLVDSGPDTDDEEEGEE